MPDLWTMQFHRVEDDDPDIDTWAVSVRFPEVRIATIGRLPAGSTPTVQAWRHDDLCGVEVTDA